MEAVNGGARMMKSVEEVMSSIKRRKINDSGDIGDVQKNLLLSGLADSMENSELISDYVKSTDLKSLQGGEDSETVVSTSLSGEFRSTSKKSAAYQSSELVPFSSTMAANSGEILYDFFPLARVYKDGRTERIGVDNSEDILPPGIDTETGVESKDIIISSDLGVSARLYLPKNVRSGHKIPLLVYFHGGAFVIGTAFSPAYHNHMNSLASEANVVIVSVDYRRAPENPLPAAYEDSWLAVKWVAASLSNAESSPESSFKDYVDFNKVYFGGDSAGGNIAHQMAMKVGIENPEGLNLVGIFLNCPFFWGKELISNNEESKPEGMKLIRNLWPFLYPNTIGLDDPLLNPVKDPNLHILGCKKVLVFVGGKDVLRDRGRYYKEELMKTVWDGEIKVIEFEEEGHVFNLSFPSTENAKSMLKHVVSFLKQ